MTVRFPNGWRKMQYELQQGRCDGYCGKSFPIEELTLDHFIPLARGGHHAPYNARLLCGPCNSKRCARDPGVMLAKMEVDRAV